MRSLRNKIRSTPVAQKRSFLTLITSSSPAIQKRLVMADIKNSRREVAVLYRKMDDVMKLQCYVKIFKGRKEEVNTREELIDKAIEAWDVLNTPLQKLKALE